MEGEIVTAPLVPLPVTSDNFMCQFEIKYVQGSRVICWRTIFYLN